MNLVYARAPAALLAVAFFLAGRAAVAQTDFRGMSLFGWGSGLGNPDLYETLYDMRTLGVDTVALNTWWKQDAKTSNVVYEDLGGMSASVAQIEHAIDLIHGLGMKVYFKPNLDSGDGVWRALIAPSNPAGWFSSYRSYINAMAELAERKDVELFSIGTEMESMANNAAYASQWTGLIGDVRARYSGDVTYAANHGDAFDGAINFGSYQDVPWWNQLDYVGVDAYFPLTGTNNPTPAQLTSAWTTRANQIDSWRTSAGVTPKILFTEVGYSSWNGTNRTPWDGPPDGAAVDQAEQRDAYQALLSVMTPKPWWEGAFWWSWETTPHAGLLQPRGFTPQDKLAQQTLANFYAGAVPPPAPRTPELVADFETGVDGFSPLNGASANVSTLGSTHNSSSLAVTTPNQSWQWVLAKQLNSSGGNGDRAWFDATNAPTERMIEFDVTYLAASIPQATVSDIRVHAALNSPAGWSQINNLAQASGRQDQTIQVSLPLSSFTTTPNPQWMSFNLAISGNWGTSPATVYFDNFRIVDLTPGLAADFDQDGDVDAADLASLRYGFGLFTHGDADRDNDTDGADLLAWQRQLVVPASAAGAAVPEPTTALFALTAATLCSARARRLARRT
jgi:hypothetical protein